MNKYTVPRSWFEEKYKNNDGSTGYLRLTKEALTRMHHQIALRAIDTYGGSAGYHTLVDIGCACGDFTAAVANKFSVAGIGLDFVRDGLLIGRERYPSLRFVTAKLPEIPLRDSTADMVMVMEVLYYLSEAELVESVCNIRRVVEVGGTVVVSITLGDGPRELNEEKVSSLFRDGFLLRGLVYEHSLLQQRFHTAIGRVLRLARREKIKVVPSFCLWARDNMAIARINFLIARLLGQRTIKKSVFIFERTAESSGAEKAGRDDA